jgi:hypothetical protein
VVDWTESMTRTYEYYIVDPNTWKDVAPLRNVKTSTVNRDLTVETLGSATIDVTELIGESYIRVYLVVIQNGVRSRHPLGTFLVQTPSSRFDGKVRNVTMDAYTPLFELKENPPPLGYSTLKGENIMESAYLLCRDNARAPVVRPNCATLLHKDFVANTDDKWVTYISDLISNAKYYLDLDELGRILFAPKQDLASMQPVWTYDDSNSSILNPEVTLNHDIFGIPNVVEVVYSNSRKCYTIRVVNDDPNSPISTVNRGREIKHLDTNPSLPGDPTEAQLWEYAHQLLKQKSTVEYTLTYSHAYCGTRLGDCVRLNYSRADLRDIKARIISQSIKCDTSCSVTEKATYTTNLWG